jgi:hypothetical protein
MMGDVVSGIANIFTGADSTKAAGAEAAGQMSAAAQAAAAAAQFRPVGMTTRFGSSQFTRETDPATGMPYVSSAGYTAAPELADLQNRLFSQFGGGLSFAQQQALQAQPMAQGAQSLFGLGQQILPTQYNTAPSAQAQQLANQYQMVSNALMPTSATPQVPAATSAYAQQLQNMGQGYLSQTPDQARAEYMRTQQAALAPGQEQQLANVRNQLFQTGRSGLATGGTTQGMAATNPEMAAYYNSLQQQNLNLAAGAEQAAQQRQAFGTGLVGQGIQTQADAAAVARQQMLENASLALGYGTQAYQTTASAEDLARQRAAADINLGAGLFGTGGQLLSQQATTMSGAYSPLQTLLGTSGQVETMAQMPYQLGIQLGQAMQPGQTAGANAYQQGMSQAAQTQYGATQAANAANAGFWGGLMGAAGNIGMGMAMKSDIRTKENIKLVGKLGNGLNVYSYEYKKEFKDSEHAGHGSFIGVMAQEVEKVIPAAVFTGKDGYKVVNYSLIG